MIRFNINTVFLFFFFIISIKRNININYSLCPVFHRFRIVLRIFIIINMSVSVVFFLFFIVIHLSFKYKILSTIGYVLNIRYRCNSHDRCHWVVHRRVCFVRKNRQISNTVGSNVCCRDDFDISTR